MLVDEHHHFGGGGSISFAKADTAFKIEFARSNSRTRRSNSFIRASLSDSEPATRSPDGPCPRRPAQASVATPPDAHPRSLATYAIAPR